MKALVGLLSVTLLAASLAATTAAAEPSPGGKTPAGTPPLWELLRQALVSAALREQAQNENLSKPDPTKPGPILRPLLGQSKSGQAAPLPPILLRARVLNSHLPPAALLDIGGRLHLVRQGDDLTLPQTSYTLRVVELDRRAVRLEVEPGKQVLTLD